MRSLLSGLFPIPLLLGGLLSATLAGTSLQAEDCVAVAGDRIVPADLGLPQEVAGAAEADLGPAPLPGFKRFVQVEVAGEAKRFCVVRALLKLERSRVEQALSAAVERLLGAGHGAQIEVVAFTDQALPEGALELAAKPTPPRAGAAEEEPVLWPGKLQVSPRQSYPIWVKARVWISRSCWEASQELPAGKPVSLSSFQLATRRRNALLAQPECIGKEGLVAEVQLRRSMRQGEILLPTHLKIQPMVRAGALVTAEWAGQVARLRFPVQAETPGNAGEVVTVRNVATGKRLQAVVIGPTMVRMGGL